MLVRVMEGTLSRGQPIRLMYTEKDYVAEEVGLLGLEKVKTKELRAGAVGYVIAGIKAIQDIMRKDRGINGDAQRIEQLVWMLFLKVLDDREHEYELLDDSYKSPMPQKYRWRKWAADPEGITGNALLDFVNTADDFVHRRMRGDLTGRAPE